jgi:hypothetical protein
MPTPNESADFAAPEKAEPIEVADFAVEEVAASALLADAASAESHWRSDAVAALVSNVTDPRNEATSWVMRRILYRRLRLPRRVAVSVSRATQRS